MNKQTSTNILCPKLSYRKGGEIFFVSEYPLKFIINGKKVFLNELSLGKNISLNSFINVFGYDISCQIIEKELEKGMKINLKYNKEYNIPKYELQKIGFYIETSILGLNIDFDNMDEKEGFEKNVYSNQKDSEEDDNHYQYNIDNYGKNRDEEYYNDEFNNNDDFYYGKKWTTSY